MATLESPADIAEDRPVVKYPVTFTACDPDVNTLRLIDAFAAANRLSYTRPTITMLKSLNSEPAGRLVDAVLDVLRALTADRVDPLSYTKSYVRG